MRKRLIAAIAALIAAIGLAAPSQASSAYTYYNDAWDNTVYTPSGTVLGSGLYSTKIGLYRPSLGGGLYDQRIQLIFDHDVIANVTVTSSASIQQRFLCHKDFTETVVSQPLFTFPTRTWNYPRYIYGDAYQHNSIVTSSGRCAVIKSVTTRTWVGNSGTNYSHVATRYTRIGNF